MSVAAQITPTMSPWPHCAAALRKDRNILTAPHRRPRPPTSARVGWPVAMACRLGFSIPSDDSRVSMISASVRPIDFVCAIAKLRIVNPGVTEIEILLKDCDGRIAQRHPETVQGFRVSVCSERLSSSMSGDDADCSSDGAAVIVERLGRKMAPKLNGLRAPGRALQAPQKPHRATPERQENWIARQDCHPRRGRSMVSGTATPPTNFLNVR